MTRLVPRGEHLFTADAPLSFFGVRVGSRMTLVRLPDGSLLVHSPVALCDALRAEVDALGAEVAHVVAPNVFHHLSAGSWIEAFPRATLHAPRALRKKRPDLRVDRDLEDATASTWSGALVPLHVDGSMLDETVLVHPASRSLLSADLTENFRTSDHLPTRIYLRLGGIHGKPGWNRMLRFLYRDRRAARRSVDALLEHDFDRAIVAHGDVLETGGKDALRATFAFL